MGTLNNAIKHLVKTDIQLKDNKNFFHTFKNTFLICSELQNINCVLGMNFLGNNKYKPFLTIGHLYLIKNREYCDIPTSKSQDGSSHSLVTSCSTVILAPYAEALIPAKVHSTTENKDDNYLLQNILNDDNIIIEDVVDNFKSDNITHVNIHNISNNNISIQSNQPIMLATNLGQHQSNMNQIDFFSTLSKPFCQDTLDKNDLYLKPDIENSSFQDFQMELPEVDENPTQWSYKDGNFDSCTPEEKQKFLLLLQTKSKVFATTKMSVGDTHLLKHHIQIDFALTINFIINATTKTNSIKLFFIGP